MWIWGLIFTTACAFAQTTTPLPANDWSKLTTPTLGTSNPIGFYSEGCIAGAKALPLNGAGYQTMRTSRNRYYGHPNTLQFVQNLGKQLDDAGSAILVGDLGQARGGPLPYGHASHQIGLDVDIWFWTHPEQRVRSLTPEERDTLPFVDMLNEAGTEINPAQFTQTQILKLKLAAENEQVERIFVNPVIKAYLCKKLPASEKTWLHKLRPWEGHNEHFHVRLACPKNTECEHQDPVPPGNGCSDISLPVKKDPAHQKQDPLPTPKIILPAHCEEVKNAP